MPTVQSNGIMIHYDEIGQGDPALLIMGLGADLTLWEQHVAEYRRHFRCIVFDNRGAGLSDKPPGPYTTEMMADDTAGLMDALGVEKAHIAGISMGGAIAQNLALKHPDRVRSLMLISTWPRCDTYTRVIFEHFKRLRPVASLEAFAQMIQLWIYAPQFYETRYDELREAQLTPPDNPMPVDAYAAQCDACMTHDTLDRLAGIAAPTLVTVGERDIFTPLHYSQAIHERIARSEMLVFPRCGHVHHWEDLDRFNRTTSDFMLAH